MKAVVLKPIVWNSLNYLRPSGNVGGGGFPSEAGYGHEEWNNNRHNGWDEFRLFHTEAPDRLKEYAQTGELGMLIIASNGPQYAVGIAVNVYYNNEELREIISSDLNLYRRWKDIWRLQIVKDKYENDQELFLEEWKKNYKWMAWRCQPACFHWFNEPIKLFPKKISGKAKLINEYNRHQRIAPEQVLDIVRDYLPEDSEIIRWLEDDNFDPKMLPDDYEPPRAAVVPGKGGGGNRPTDESYSYQIVSKVLVEPKHSKLQERYVEFLEEQGFDLRENENYIDVIYERDGHEIFVEIKPTDNLQSKYAIRFAIGQLLEYRFKQNQDARLEIVLSARPSNPQEIEFVQHLGMTLTYFDPAQDTFISI